ncbi:MAG: hypothetical protein WC565_03485 [Parcubacteria group bacterium]
MSLHASVMTMLLALPPAHADLDEQNRSERVEVIASAISQATQRACCSGAYASEECSRLWAGSESSLAALIVTKGWWESRFALNVHLGECKPWECDAVKLSNGSVMHLARTPWQFQRTAFSAPLWTDMVGTGIEPTRNAAWVAARILSHGMKSCKSIEGTIAWYATGRCQWSKARDRYATYRKLTSLLASRRDS